MRKAATLIIAAALCMPLAAYAKKSINTAQSGSSVTFQPKGLIRNFSTVIPSGTKVLYTDGSNETTYSFSSGKADMRIRAIYTKNPDLISQIQAKKWELRDMDPSIRTIIDGQNITIRKSVQGTLLVYQFRENRKKPVIQRTLITGQGSFIYIIDCRAPVNDFYKYEDGFNVLMGGFKITGEEAPVEEKIAAEPEDRIQEATPAEETRKPDVNTGTDDLDSMGLKEDTTEEIKSDATPLGPENKPAQ